MVHTDLAIGLAEIQRKDAEGFLRRSNALKYAGFVENHVQIIAAAVAHPLCAIFRTCSLDQYLME